MIPETGKPEPESGTRERPHPTAQWYYIGEWVEVSANGQTYRYRLAAADNGSWRATVVEHRTRRGWGNVGKRVREGINIGRALAARGVPDEAYSWTGDARLSERTGDE